MADKLGDVTTEIQRAVESGDKCQSHTAHTCTGGFDEKSSRDDEAVHVSRTFTASASGISRRSGDPTAPDAVDIDRAACPENVRRSRCRHPVRDIFQAFMANVATLLLCPYVARMH